MTGKKYASDYQIVYEVAADGKRRARRVYCGQRYTYLQSPAQLHRLRNHILLSVGSIIGLLLPLFWNHTGMDKTWYVILPAAFAVVPLYALCAGARQLGASEPLITREHRDKTDGRLRKASVWLLLLLSVSCGGCWVYWGRHGLGAGEGLNGLCLHLTLPICGYLLTQRKKAASVPADQETNHGGQL